MRIAIWHNLPSGGGKRALHGHIAGLVQRGHHVESWCPSTADGKYLPLSGLCREHILPFTLPAARKAPPLLGWATDYRATALQLRALREHAAACAAQIRAGNFDVVLANSCVVSAMPPIAQELGGLPCAVYLGEPNRRLYEAHLNPRWAAPETGFFGVMVDALKTSELRLQKREEINNARAFDRILVNSFFSRESVLRSYGVESEVCYLGIDTDFFRPTDAPVEKFVLGFGAVDFHKGVDRAIEALGCVRRELRPKLLWVGNNANQDYIANLSRRAAELGVEFEVRVLVPDAELISLLGRAAAVLYTSRLEPFGLAPLEANACGTPVLAVAEGGVRESIVDGENGLLMLDAAPRNMAAVIERFFSEPGLADDLRKKSRAAVLSRWGREAGIDRLETILKRLAAEKSRSKR